MINKKIEQMQLSMQLDSNRGSILNMIRPIRLILKLTFKALASVLGISEASAVRWEKGTVDVEFHQLTRIQWLKYISEHINDRVDENALQYVLNVYSLEIVVLLCYHSKIIPKLPAFYDSNNFLEYFYHSFNSNMLLLPSIIHKISTMTDDDPDKMNKFISENRDEINAKNFIGNTALHIATEKKHLNTIKSLLKNGADINIKNNENVTALISTLNKKDKNYNTTYEIIELFIEHGANVNEVDKIFQSPLFLAAHNYDSPEIIDVLISAGADINYFPKESQLCTPLMAAIMNNNTQVAIYLIKKGAKLNIQDRNGLTAIHYAVSKNNPAIVKLLLDKNADPCIKDEDGHTALDYAKMTNRTKIIELFSDQKRGGL